MQTLVRKSWRDGNLNPALFNYLTCLSDHVVFPDHGNLPDPLAIYNLSINRISEAFHNVLNELEKFDSFILLEQGHPPDTMLSKFPALQKELLDSLLAHIDDCYWILVALDPKSPTDPKNKQFSNKWLEEIKHPSYKKFETNVEGYRSSFAIIPNKIKHQYGRLRSLMQYAQTGGITEIHRESGLRIQHRKAYIIGYYLEGSQHNQTVGVDLDVHPDNTAISLNHDLKYHFANLYRVDQHLKDAVALAVRETYDVKLPRVNRVETPPARQNLAKIAKRISKLPNLFFSNEFSLPTPKVSFHEDSRGEELSIQFHPSSRIEWIGDSMFQFEVRLEDGRRNTYKLPYISSIF